MKPLIVICVAFAGLLAGNKVIRNQWNATWAGTMSMSILMVFTAIGHFVYTNEMAQMIPDFFPFREMGVILSGILELGFAVVLALQKWKRKTGIALIIFLLLVLPINVYAAMHHINYQTGQLDGPGLEYLWFRVPLQLFFIVWVYFFVVYSTEKKMASQLR